MSDQPQQRIRLEDVDWSSVLPWICLFRSFRAAIGVRRLLPALALVVLAYVGAGMLDTVSGARTYPGEIAAFANRPRGEYEPWRQRQRERETADVESTGVLAAALEFKLDAIGRLARAAGSLDFGFAELTQPSLTRAQTGDSVVAAMRDLLVTLPRWLIDAHPWLLLAYMFLVLALWSVCGGTIARLAALGAAEPPSAPRSAVDGPARQSPLPPDAGVGLAASVRFALARFSRFFVVPVFPWIFAGLMAVLLMFAGLVLFSLPALDIIGGLFFFVALALGLAITMIMLLSIGAGALFYPAIAVDDADMFDAVSRALGYVLARPWRWLFYTTMTVVYGAITCFFVGLVLFLTVAAAHYFLRAGVIRDVAGVNRFDLILAAPELGVLTPDLGGADLTISGKISAGLVWLWVTLFRALLPAYAISFFITANTWIYLLLRRAADGNELDDVYLGPSELEVAVGADDVGDAD